MSPGVCTPIISVTLDSGHTRIFIATPSMLGVPFQYVDD